MSAALERVKASVAWTAEHRPALEQISLQLDDVRELLAMAEREGLRRTLEANGCHLTPATYPLDPAQLSALPEP